MKQCFIGMLYFICKFLKDVWLKMLIDQDIIHFCQTSLFKVCYILK